MTMQEQFEVITETNLAFGPFPTKEAAIKKAAELGLGEMNAGNDESGWVLSRLVTKQFKPCAGCDGHECDDHCAYPGVVSPH